MSSKPTLRVPSIIETMTTGILAEAKEADGRAVWFHQDTGWHADAGLPPSTVSQAKSDIVAYLNAAGFRCEASS